MTRQWSWQWTRSVLSNHLPGHWSSGVSLVAAEPSAVGFFASTGTFFAPQLLSIVALPPLRLVTRSRPKPSKLLRPPRSSHDATAYSSTTHPYAAQQPCFSMASSLLHRCSFLSQRRCYATERLSRLQAAAEEAPHDIFRVTTYLREAVGLDSRLVLRHLETHPTCPVSNEVFQIYIQALCSDIRQLTVTDFSAMATRLYKYNSAALPAEGVAGAGSALSASSGQPSRLQLVMEADSKPLKVVIADSNKYNFWRAIRQVLGLLIIVAAISVFAESLAQNVQKGFGMGSKKIQPVEDTKTTFEDVKGCDEVKGELEELVSYLKDPNKFSRLGAKLPKGVLLAGKPGTGKTLLARAIAGEAKVPFLQASGSEFEEMFVGVGARRIRELFAAARKHAPCIVFIDEIDAVGSKRTSRDNAAVRMTLNQLLVELDGFEQNEGIVVICATNFSESLDRALTRPGRLDKEIVVPLPDLLGRTQILQLYAEKLVMSEDVDLTVVAKRSAGMTGADLFNILNIAAVKSSADGRPSISAEYVDLAYDRVVVGLERRNPMSEQERRMTAYHEGGHTIVANFTKGTDPVHKATIMPRGATLGVTWTVPEERYSDKLSELLSRLDVLMGGKAAESLVYGEENVTAGCTSDLKTATAIARDMIMRYGMGMPDTKAPQYIDPDMYFSLSEDTRKLVDSNVQKLLEEAYGRAAKVLEGHEEQLHNLAKALLEYETLDSEEIQIAMAGKIKEIAERRTASTSTRSRTKQSSSQRSKQESLTAAADKSEEKRALSSDLTQKRGQGGGGKSAEGDSGIPAKGADDDSCSTVAPQQTSVEHSNEVADKKGRRRSIPISDGRQFQ